MYMFGPVDTSFMCVLSCILQALLDLFFDPLEMVHIQGFET